MLRHNPGPEIYANMTSNQHDNQITQDRRHNHKIHPSNQKQQLHVSKSEYFQNHIDYQSIISLRVFEERSIHFHDGSKRTKYQRFSR